MTMPLPRVDRYQLMLDCDPSKLTAEQRLFANLWLDKGWYETTYPRFTFAHCQHFRSLLVALGFASPEALATPGPEQDRYLGWLARWRGSATAPSVLAVDLLAARGPRQTWIPIKDTEGFPCRFLWTVDGYPIFAWLILEFYQFTLKNSRSWLSSIVMLDTVTDWDRSLGSILLFDDVVEFSQRPNLGLDLDQGCATLEHTEGALDWNSVYDCLKTFS